MDQWDKKFDVIFTVIAIATAVGAMTIVAFAIWAGVKIFHLW